MNKLIPATLAVAAILAITPAFAGETVISAQGDTPTTIGTTSTTVHTETAAPVAVMVPVPADATVTGVTSTTTTTTTLPATVTTTSVTEDATPAETKVESYMLQDGTNVVVMDKKAYIIGTDGMKKTAPDGNIMTKNGVSLKIRDGVLVTDTVPGAAGSSATEVEGNAVVAEPTTISGTPNSSKHE